MRVRRRRFSLARDLIAVGVLFSSDILKEGRKVEKNEHSYMQKKEQASKERDEKIQTI